MAGKVHSTSVSLCFKHLEIEKKKKKETREYLSYKHIRQLFLSKLTMVIDTIKSVKGSQNELMD